MSKGDQYNHLKLVHT